MKLTDQTLMQQMQISLPDIQRRKQLLGLTEEALAALATVRGLIEPGLQDTVAEFYDYQTSVPEINNLIGDVDTLKRLKVAQHQYILDLFSGCYDSVYVNNRLRIGLVHKRIGVEPRLYLAALHQIKLGIFKLVEQYVADAALARQVQDTLEKLYTFDITLVVETYIWSLVKEVNSSHHKLQEYAMALGAHAQEMETLSRLDPLTGLYNVRSLTSMLNELLYRARQQHAPVTVVFIDINDFKLLNDQYGHVYGDQVIQAVASTLKQIARDEDYCFRYGGDEFLVILPNCTEVDALQSFIPRVEQTLSQLTMPVSLSVGIHQADANSGYLDSASLIRCADDKMYAVKKQYKLKGK